MQTFLSNYFTDCFRPFQITYVGNVGHYMNSCVKDWIEPSSYLIIDILAFRALDSGKTLEPRLRSCIFSLQIGRNEYKIQH